MAIVGWILLGILCFILCLLLLILFFPISYKLEGKKNGSVSALARVHWLFGLFRARFDYPTPSKLIVKIAFFTVIGRGKKEDRRRKKHGLKKQKQVDAAEGMEPVEVDGKAQNPDNYDLQTEANDLQTEANDLQTERNDLQTERNDLQIEATDLERMQQVLNASKEEAEKSEPEKGFEEKKDRSVKKQKSPILERKEKKGKTGKSILQRLKTEWDFYYGLWQDEPSRAFVKEAISRGLHIVRNLMPKRISGKVIFGAGSPDVTGYVYGGYCIGSSLFPKKIRLYLEPDFENRVLEGEVLISGHFMVFSVLLDGLRLLFDRRLKRIRHKIKRHQKKKA